MKYIYLHILIYVMSGDNDGLSSDEMLKLLFKSYMNFGSSSHDKEFFEETIFENATNIFGNEVMKNQPTKAPNFVSAANAVIKEYLEKNDSTIVIDDGWVSTKTINGDSNSRFLYDESDPSILRFEKIKLDYLGGNGNAFGCYDSCFNNVLRNLIPFSYSASNPTDYNITLWFKDVSEYKVVSWLKPLSDQRIAMTSTNDEDINWGAPLFDTKNGVITFYDVNSPSGGAAIFGTSSSPTPEFYISATKYVGEFGVGDNINGAIDVSSLHFDDIALSKKALSDETIDIYIKSNSGFTFYTQDNDLSENRLPTNPILIAGKNYRFQYLTSDPSRNDHLFGFHDPSYVIINQWTGTNYMDSGNQGISGNETLSISIAIGSPDGHQVSYTKWSGIEGTHEPSWYFDVEEADSILEISGNVSIAGNLNLGNNTITAGTFIGDGSQLSGITMVDACGNLDVEGTLNVSNSITCDDLVVGGINMTETQTTSNINVGEIVDIYVKLYGDGGIHPYYFFYRDADATQQMLTQPTLYLNKTYRFTRIDGGHPFYIADQSAGVSSTSAITISGDGTPSSGITDDESFTLTFNSLTINGPLTYFCTAHPGTMNATFALKESEEETKTALTISDDVDLGAKTITAGTFIGDGSQLSGVALIDASGNLDLSNNTITADTFIGDGSQLSGVALIDASGNLDLSNNTLTTKAIQFNETTPPADNDIGTLGNLRFNASRDLLEYYGKDNIWNSLTTYKSEQPPKLRNASFSSHSQYIDLSWDMFETRITDSHDGKKYPLSLQTYVDISYDFGDASSNGWETLYIGNGTYDNDGNENTHGFETFRLYGLQTTDYSNNTGYSIAFNSKPDPISTALPSFDQSSTPFDLRLYGVNQSGQAPNYVYLYGFSLEPTGAPGPVEVTATRDFQQNQFTMDLSFALNSLNPSTTTGIDITQYDVSFHMVESKRFASADPIDHSGVYQIVWDGISGLSNTEIDLSNLYPGAKYDVMVRAQNRGLAGVDGSYGDTSFTSTDFTNVGATQYITLNDLEPVNPQGMTFTLVNSASIRCCISGNNTLANKTIMNSNGEIDISGTSDFYVNFGKQGVDMSGAGVLVNVSLDKLGNSSVSTTIPYSSIENDTSYTFLGYDFEKGAYQDKGDSSKNEGFVYGSTIHVANDSNTDFNTHFPASTNYNLLQYTIISSGNNNSAAIDKDGASPLTTKTDRFYVDDYSAQNIVSYDSTPTLSVSKYTTLFGIPSIHQLQLTANIRISNFANCVIPHDSSGNHSFISDISNNSYQFPLRPTGKMNSIQDYIIPYSEVCTISSSGGTHEPNTTESFVTNVYYLEHLSGAPVMSTDVSTTQINNLGILFKDSDTTYVGLDIHSFNFGSTVSSQPLDPSENIVDIGTLLYFNGRFVSGGYSAVYNGTTVYAFSDWQTGHCVKGTNYSNYSNTGHGSYKYIVLNVTSLRTNSSTISLSHFKINNEPLNMNDFGSVYEAYVVKRTNDNDIFGALNNYYNITEVSWFNQGWTTSSSSKNGNGTIFDNDIILDDSDTESQYFFIMGLLISSSNFFTVDL